MRWTPGAGRRPCAVVPTALRTATLVCAAAASAVLVLLVVVVRRAPGAPTVLDSTLATALRGTWRPGVVAYAVDGLVGLVPVLVAVTVLAGAALLSGRRLLALLAPLGPLGSAAATTLLKPLVGRTIHGDNLSFPSGHTAYATSLGLVVGLLLVALVRPRRVVAGVALILCPALATGAVMAVDQVAIDAHYATDTVGGFCTALVVVLIGALALDLAARRSRSWRVVPRSLGLRRPGDAPPGRPGTVRLGSDRERDR